MKKFIIISLISFLIPCAASADQQVEDIYNDLLNINQKFFESAVMPSVDIQQKTKNTKEYYNDNSQDGMYLYDWGENDQSDDGRAVYSLDQEKYVDHMPFFKKARLKYLHFYKEQAQKADEKYEKRMQAKQQEEYETDLDEKNVKPVSLENKQQNVDTQKTELSGGIQTQKTKTEMMLDCDEVKVNEETGDVEALGHPILVIPENKVKLVADKMTYNNDSNILKAIGNVVLTKDGKPVYGDYLQVNMNEENVLMDNPYTQGLNMSMRAKKAEQDNGITTATDGTLNSAESRIFRFSTSMIGPDFRNIVVDKNQQQYWFSGGDNKLKIDASEINIEAGKSHDIYHIKDAEIFRNNKFLFTLPSFTAYTNKDHTTFEANYPEFGSISSLGMFAGPGLVTKGPYGSILKWIPFLNYADSKFGFGGAVKFRSAFNQTDIMYGSSRNVFVAKGRQYLDDNLYLDYVSNAYMDNWFLGGRMPRYAAELTYKKNSIVKNMLGRGRNMIYSQRASVAIAQDGEYNNHRESIVGTGTITPRFRYMAQINQNLYTHANMEERKMLSLALLMQGSAAVYGTGDTQIIGRIGPSIHTQYKNWMQDISFLVSGYSDNTPLPVFDSYRYGHANLYVHEAIRLHKYLSLGWSGSISLLKDSPNGEMFQENAFIIAVGPDDFKVSLGYDVIRKTTYFGLSLAFDSKNTTVDFDKMMIKDAERLGKTDNNDSDLIFKAQEDSSKAKNLQYAEVINIEDPNKEQI